MTVSNGDTDGDVCLSRMAMKEHFQRRHEDDGKSATVLSTEFSQRCDLFGVEIQSQLPATEALQRRARIVCVENDRFQIGQLVLPELKLDIVTFLIAPVAMPACVLRICRLQARWRI